MHSLKLFVHDWHVFERPASPSQSFPHDTNVL